VTRPSLDDTKLEARLVGELAGHFHVPGYQRGYRWGEPDVSRLLDDVKAAGTEPYFLQPIVVKARQDGKWELIDGQQRLTTLFLILQYIQTHLPAAKPGYTLEYETRPDSQGYLTALDADQQKHNIDFFHIYQAFECIAAWFEGQANPLQAAIDFYTATSKSLQVIWYEAPESTNSKELFRRLNLGRIPLTDAELVKALLLARIRGTDPRSNKVHQVAAQWDVIERSLRDPELWAFVTRRTHEEATHIELLLDTLADFVNKPPPGPRPRFHTFEALRPSIEASPKRVWDQVQDLHSLLLGWYEDSTLYHWIGYVVASGKPFRAVVAMAQGLTKAEFKKRLADEIRQGLRLTEAQVRDLAYPSAKCTEVLLLMTVETVRRREGGTQRFSFRSHVLGKWSLEHIHAQNAEPLQTADQWKQWLTHHRKALDAVPTSDPPGREELLGAIDLAITTNPLTEARFRQLEQRVISAFSLDAPAGEDEVHSIANLALLASGDNSALSNSVFEVKRQEILRRDKAGAYIPACTRDVFLKYYTDSDAQQLHFWGPQDREGYLAAMLMRIDPFLTQTSAQ
jgi:hypothetical protein